jgi:hypothetical protein
MAQLPKHKSPDCRRRFHVDFAAQADRFAGADFICYALNREVL